MLIVFRYLVPDLFLFGIVGGQGLVKDFVIDLFQILVAKGHILPHPAPVYICRCKAPVVVPDTASTSHAGYSCPDKITHPFYRPYPLLFPSYHSPSEGTTPLCYFLGEKVTQKHFHTAAPLWRQYESAFARSRGEHRSRPAAAVSRCSCPAPAGASAPLLLSYLTGTNDCSNTSAYYQTNSYSHSNIIN